MSYTVFTDTSANLPTRMVNELAVSIVPYSYYVDGEERSCLDTDAFNGDEYYAAIKSGVRATTSHVPPQRYIEYF